jgi:CheY-like chemotaxis protein
MRRKKRSVLLVEDYPELRRLLKECLTGLDLEAIEAADGRTALNRLKEVQPDLVCLDVVLPESSGYEVVEHIRSSPHLAHVPVLMMSGRNLPGEPAFAAEAGASAFLAKPFSRAEFRSQVSHLLQSHPFGAAGEGK